SSMTVSRWGSVAAGGTLASPEAGACGAARSLSALVLMSAMFMSAMLTYLTSIVRAGKQFWHRVRCWQSLIRGFLAAGRGAYAIGALPVSNRRSGASAQPQP